MKRQPSELEKKAALALAGYSTCRYYLVGVSGGRDSVALLHLLLQLGYKNLVVGHLDHALRGNESRQDARFVKRLAARFDLPFVEERIDVAELAQKQKRSIETAGREARFAFFARVAIEKKCTALFLAHHADDQVETFLLNLFRGAAVPGLGAMRLESVRAPKLKVLRPFLAVWREEIDRFISDHRLKFREDASNLEPLARRNQLRLKFLPLLKTCFGAGIKKSIWRTAEILATENDWIKSLIKADTPELSVPELRAMPVALQRRSIHAWLKYMKAPDIGFEKVEAVRFLLEKNVPAKINLPGGLHVRRRNKKLFLE